LGHPTVVREIDVHELQQKLAKREPVYLIDVRQPWEHRTAALPDSVPLPLGELMARAGELRPPPGALVVVYCHHGVRSLSAAALLQRLGVENVASLHGGIDAWSCEIDRSVPRY
jgi:rhodanese-related sulfurtransferase